MAKKPPPPRGPQLDIAGNLTVAFINTAAARARNRQQGVASYAELLTWSLQVAVLQAHDAERLAAKAAKDPKAALAVYAEVNAVRAALARLFLAQQFDRDLPAADLQVFNQALARTLPATRLVPAERGLAWGFAGDDDALDRMLWPLLFNAAELLISAEGRPYVRQCAAPDCRLFFLDRSPSRQRRWCEMKTCGNRVKSLRHYQRTGKARRETAFRDLGVWRRQKPRESQELPAPGRKQNRNVF